ncbi:MAG TPA: SCO family protein [Bryobacteraceae bacterium]|nr:SCO family protein [Bryobacteraceae bacterium]
MTLDIRVPRRLSACALSILCVILLASCVRPTALPVLGEIPEFQLTSQTGQVFDSHSLDGHVWVADFIYTTCTGPCPMMSAQMRQIQNSTAETPGVLLISMTVDPVHDTPPVLTEYARHFKQDPARWTFLTGEVDKLNDLGVHAFKLNSVDGSLTHSTRFVLVDRHRRIRGFYTSGEDAFMPKLLHDIRQLEQDRS